MFYPEAVDAATLISVLLTAQDRIAETCQIRIGIGAHLGDRSEEHTSELQSH